MRFVSDLHHRAPVMVPLQDSSDVHGQGRINPRWTFPGLLPVIGLEQGFIGQEIFGVIVLMSLLATLITPIVYRNWFYEGEVCEPGPEI